MQFAATRDSYSAPFFDAAANGTLLARQCGNGHWLAPYVAYGSTLSSCPFCGDGDLSWAAVEGTATLVSWTVIAGMPAVTGGNAEQISGIVELAEGPWVYAAIDVPPDQLTEGLSLTVDFVRPGDGEPVPVFRTDAIPA
jgi:uncharacterized OB-fold protein